MCTSMNPNNMVNDDPAREFKWCQFDNLPYILESGVST
jgi:hypothetical protein